MCMGHFKPFKTIYSSGPKLLCLRFELSPTGNGMLQLHHRERRYAET